MLWVKRRPKDTLSGIAALYRCIEVVPVVQDAQFEERLRGSLLATQQRVCAVEQSPLGLRLNG